MIDLAIAADGSSQTTTGVLAYAALVTLGRNWCALLTMLAKSAYGLNTERGG